MAIFIIPEDCVPCSEERLCQAIEDEARAAGATFSEDYDNGTRHFAMSGVDIGFAGAEGLSFFMRRGRDG